MIRLTCSDWRMLKQKKILSVWLFLLTFSLSAGASVTPSAGEHIDTAKQMALSNSVTWRRSGLRHLYDRMDEVRGAPEKIGRWSVKQYQSWEQGSMSCDHQFVLLGVDRLVSENLILGSTVDLGKGSSYYNQGLSSAQTIGASVYGTYSTGNGSYFAALLKLGVLRLKSILWDSEEKNTSQGIYFGLGYGHKWNPLSTFSLDPQVRLTYSRLGAEAITDKGYSIQYDPIENFVLAFRLKGQMQIGQSASTYFLLGYYRDMMGRVSGHYRQDHNKYAFSDSLFDTWGRARVGADYQLDEQITASFEAENTFGKEYQDHAKLSCFARYLF